MALVDPLTHPPILIYKPRLGPIKKAKGQDALETADQWLFTAMSLVRQPFESWFN